jgi:hypothetical protein
LIHSTKDLETNDTYSYQQVFNRELSKKIEHEEHMYPKDEEKARIYLEEERFIKPEFEMESKKLSQEILGDFEGMTVLKLR